MSTTQQCDTANTCEDKKGQALETNHSNISTHIFGDYNVTLCSLCKKPLQPPIVFVINLGNVCGPCCKSEDENTRQNWMAYTIPLFNEAITMISTIPMACMNKQFGCKEILHFSNKQEHELNCKLVGVPCLLSKAKVNPCNWRGMHSKCLDHFQEAHQDSIMHSQDGSFEIELFTETDFEYNRLLEFQEQRVFLYISGELAKNKISHILIDPRSKSNSAQSTDQIYSLKYYENVNGNFFSAKLCLKSFEGLFRDSERQSIDFKGILNSISCTNLPKLTCTITFPTKSTKESTKEIGTKEDTKQNIPNNLDRMEDLNCITCLTIMRPPIYLCSSGHSICYNCYKNIKTNCPLCQKEYKGARNYSLEKFITSFYNFRCCYEKFGCSVVQSYKNLTEHEMKCTYKKYKCPIQNCTFGGVQAKLRTHLDQIHMLSYMYFNEYYVRSIFHMMDIEYSSYFVRYHHLFEFYTSTNTWSNTFHKMYFSLRILGELTPEMLILVSKLSFEITIKLRDEWNTTISKVGKCLPPSRNIKKGAICFDLKINSPVNAITFSDLTVGTFKFRLIYKQ